MVMFLFTCSLNGKVKLWEILNIRKCLIYSEGVRGISLSIDGK